MPEGANGIGPAKAPESPAPNARARGQPPPSAVAPLAATTDCVRELNFHSMVSPRRIVTEVGEKDHRRRR